MRKLHFENLKRKANRVFDFEQFQPELVLIVAQLSNQFKLKVNSLFTSDPFLGQTLKLQGVFAKKEKKKNGNPNYYALIYTFLLHFCNYIHKR